MKNTIITFMLAACIAFTAQAQAPSWSVNSSEYENSMAVVAVAKVQNQLITNTNSMIGAFIGGELRGVANTSFVNSENQYVAHILVWSNVGGGETITFQIYDAASGQIVDAVNSIVFENDGTEGTTATPYIITDNNPPTDIAISANAVDENAAIGTVVGQLSSTDPDGPDTFSYELVAGTGDGDNNAFLIQDQELLTNQVFDFEAKSVFSVRLRTTDSKSGFFEKVFTITINDLNEGPTDIQISKTDINENQAIGSIIGSFTSVDEDTDDSFTYTLVEGEGSDDNASFSIDDDKLLAGISFNFEAKASYLIRVKTEDGDGLSFEKPFTISINDINDNPTSVSLSVLGFDENLPIGDRIGALETADQDGGDRHIYTFVNNENNNNELFTIIDNGLYTNALFNYEERDTYFINVQSNDQRGGVVTNLITVGINNENDVPTDITLAGSSIEENLPVGSLVGYLDAADEDANESFTYALVAGTGADDNGRFQVVGNEVRSNAVFDYETKNLYSIRVEVTDSDNAKFQKILQPQIVNKNDPPTSIIALNTTVFENLPFGNVITDLNVVDQDLANTHAISLASGDSAFHNNMVFVASNQLLMRQPLDFESMKQMIVRLKATDNSGASVEKVLVFEVLDVIDSDVVISNASFPEDLMPGDTIGQLGLDDRSAEGFSFSLLHGINDNSYFGILGNYLVLSNRVNYEEQAIYAVDFEAKDIFDQKVFTRINLTTTDVNDAPEDILLSNHSINENSAGGGIIGALSTVDQDVNDQFQYELTDGSADNEFFAITNGNTLRSTEAFNFEEKNSYNIAIRVTDAAGASFTKNMEIEVLNLNEAPQLLSPVSNIELRNDESKFIQIENSWFKDEDINDALSYRLALANGADLPNWIRYASDTRAIVIDPRDIQLAQDEYVLHLIATDQGGLSVTNIMRISISIVSGLNERGIAFNIYPNPAQDHINLQLPQIRQTDTPNTRIVNMMGQIVKQYDFVPTGLNISDLRTGVYIIYIRANGQSYWGRFIKN